MSRTKFVIVFVLSAFAFQFISNSLLGPEMRLFPNDGEAFPGTGSPIAWKSILATIVFPIKFILLGPLSAMFTLDDPPPPMFVLAYAIYWSGLALVIYYLSCKFITRKQAV